MTWKFFCHRKEEYEYIRPFDGSGAERGGSARNPDIIIIIYNYLFFVRWQQFGTVGPKLRKRQRGGERRAEKETNDVSAAAERRSESRLSPRQTTTANNYDWIFIEVD